MKNKVSTSTKNTPSKTKKLVLALYDKKVQTKKDLKAKATYLAKNFSA